MWQILSHKILAMFAGFFNVMLAAAVLDPEVSYLYLTTLSASQIFMAFSGFGLTQRLVILPEEDASQQRVWPWFGLTLIAGIMVFVWLYQQSAIDPPIGVVVFTSCLLLLLLLAEWLRAAMARQVGFVIYNLSLLVAAFVILWQRDISVMLAIIPCIGVVVLLWQGRGFYKFSGVPLHPKLADLVRALRVASVNQYYNLIVLLFPFVGVDASVLGILLVFRFGIFYNWQNFFWLRFGHKQLTQNIDNSHKRQNRKFILMNMVAFVGTVIVLWAVILFDLFRFVPSGAFDREFAYLLIYFAALKVGVNLIFPYEVFLLYRSTLRVDLMLLIGALACLTLLGVGIMSLTNTFLLITLVELVWLAWRIISWWIVKNDTKHSTA
jgi:hypothetical protein